MEREEAASKEEDEGKRKVLPPRPSPPPHFEETRSTQAELGRSTNQRLSWYRLSYYRTLQTVLLSCDGLPSTTLHRLPPSLSLLA